MPEHVIEGFTEGLQRLGASASSAARQLREIRALMDRYREHWLITGPGQWPDRFTLLNRYVRTGHEPLYTFND